jgi:hypothetical protein
MPVTAYSNAPPACCVCVCVDLMYVAEGRDPHVKSIALNRLFFHKAQPYCFLFVSSVFFVVIVLVVIIIIILVLAA